MRTVLTLPLLYVASCANALIAFLCLPAALSAIQNSDWASVSRWTVALIPSAATVAAWLALNDEMRSLSFVLTVSGVIGAVLVLAMFTVLLGGI